MGFARGSSRQELGVFRSKHANSANPVLGRASSGGGGGVMNNKAPHSVFGGGSGAGAGAGAGSSCSGGVPTYGSGGGRVCSVPIRDRAKRQGAIQEHHRVQDSLTGPATSDTRKPRTTGGSGGAGREKSSKRPIPAYMKRDFSEYEAHQPPQQPTQHAQPAPPQSIRPPEPEPQEYSFGSQAFVTAAAGTAAVPTSMFSKPRVSAQPPQPFQPDTVAPPQQPFVSRKVLLGSEAPEVPVVNEEPSAPSTSSLEDRIDALIDMVDERLSALEESQSWVFAKVGVRTLHMFTDFPDQTVRVSEYEALSCATADAGEWLQVGTPVTIGSQTWFPVRHVDPATGAVTTFLAPGRSDTQASFTQFSAYPLA